MEHNPKVRIGCILSKSWHRTAELLGKSRTDVEKVYTQMFAVEISYKRFEQYRIKSLGDLRRRREELKKVGTHLVGTPHSVQYGLLSQTLPTDSAAMVSESAGITLEALVGAFSKASR